MTRLLQRTCGCGKAPVAGAPCSACAARKAQRSASQAGREAGFGSSLAPSLAPPAVYEVLNSPGHALDASVRRALEPRFGQDFSRVRLHTDGRAGASALALGAAAYTVGRDVVFAPGRYRPNTRAGNHLLAHELSHVVQQRGVAGAALQRLSVGAPHTAAEGEAEQIAERIGSGATIGPVHHRSPAVMRTLLVDEPDKKIPNPQGTGLDQTNARTVEQYLRQLSPQGNPRVEPGSGKVSMDTSFCPASLGGRVWRGTKAGFAQGARIGAYFFGLGAIVGALLGGVIGSLVGLFGGSSQTAESRTPTGSSCICGFINASRTWHIQLQDIIDDSHRPVTGSNFVQVPSPNASKIVGAALVSGRLENSEPWLVLGHELCGHAWLDLQRQQEGDVPGEDLRHHRSVERENLIRQEHGLEARGFRLKDPYCGQSFVRDKTAPAGPPQWLHTFNERDQKLLREMGKGDLAEQTDLDECQQAREQYLGDLAKRYRVDQRIP